MLLRPSRARGRHAPRGLRRPGARRSQGRVPSAVGGRGASADTIRAARARSPAGCSSRTTHSRRIAG